jgi:hypothetical protein
VVTSIKQSPFSSPDIENFIWIEPLLRGHLSYKATLSLSQRWPLNTGLTVFWTGHCNKMSNKPHLFVFGIHMTKKIVLNMGIHVFDCEIKFTRLNLQIQPYKYNLKNI